ncbi:uncharacterized protein LOC133373760 isoform X2 [Rhineura floridana]|uniref:uncharacterized protein LOC133373760 isoform X2 n=1 Tax=Rhineura floridana TaxID=261503 RepID=UPI002AC821AD|nr:uncharacterized protein LOC133373760 isoform X2 [Rhineura floridana]
MSGRQLTWKSVVKTATFKNKEDRYGEMLESRSHSNRSSCQAPGERAPGIVMYGGGLARPAQKAKEHPTIVERSSAQIIKQPQKKKKKKKKTHIQRRHIKSRRSRRRQAKSIAKLKVQGRSCSAKPLVYNRIPPQSQESVLTTCCCSFMGAVVKLVPEPRAGSLPSKRMEQSNSAGLKAEERSLSSKRVKSPGKNPNVSSLRETQRLEKPGPMEKRRYQAVSEYQFIYPGRSVYHCSRESANPQLRSIYTANARQSPFKLIHPSVRIPQCHQEINRAQWEKPSTDTKCPAGCEFLRSMPPRTLPCGLTSLTFRMDNLVLAGEKVEAVSGNPPASPAVRQSVPQMQHPPPSEKAVPPAEAFLTCAARKGDKGWSTGLGYASDLFRRGGTRNTFVVPPSHSGSPPRPRPVSAKDYYAGFALSQMFGSKEGQNRKTSEEDDAAGNWPALSASGKAAMAHARSTIVIPTIGRYSSSESVDVEGPHTAPPKCPPIPSQDPTLVCKLLPACNKGGESGWDSCTPVQ